MSSGEFKSHEIAILEHIGRYRVSFVPVLQKLTPLQKVDVVKVVRSLVKRDFISQETDRNFGSHRSLILTSKAIRTLGLEQRKSSNLGSKSKPDRITILSYCVTGGVARLPLYPSELDDILGVIPPGRHHCLERGREHSRVLNLYIPGPNVQPISVAEHLVRQSTEAADVKELAPWIESRLYQLTAVVGSTERAAAVEVAVKRLGSQSPLAIKIDITRPPEEFHEELRIMTGAASAA